MVPASTLIQMARPEAVLDRRLLAARSIVRGRRARRSALRVLVALLALAAVAAGAASIPYVAYLRASTKEGELARQTSALEARVAQAAASTTTQGARVAALRSRLDELEGKLDRLRAAKVRTVVKTKTVTERVPRWVPNGGGVSVEVTGFAGVLVLHDVQIAHAYGFTNLVGIAVNKSDRTISYAQLGCTFLDDSGTVLANGMTNKQDWAPRQTWGFTCSAEVDATGGILRVDEVS